MRFTILPFLPCVRFSNLHDLYCHDNSCLFMRYVQDTMIVQTEGQRGIRDQLGVAGQSRAFSQGTDREQSD